VTNHGGPVARIKEDLLTIGLVSRTKCFFVRFHLKPHATIGKQHGLKPQTIASWIINKSPNIDQTLPAKLIKTIVAVNKVQDIDESKLTETINKVLTKNQKAVDDYKSGKENALMFLLGATIREYGGKLDANIVKNAILKSLNN